MGRATPANRFEAAGALRRLIVEEAAARGVIIGWRSAPEPEATNGGQSAVTKPTPAVEEPAPPPLTTHQ
jgi:hypothetical protein